MPRQLFQEEKEMVGTCGVLFGESHWFRGIFQGKVKTRHLCPPFYMMIFEGWKPYILLLQASVSLGKYKSLKMILGAEVSASYSYHLHPCK